MGDLGLDLTLYNVNSFWELASSLFFGDFSKNIRVGKKLLKVWFLPSGAFHLDL